VLREAGLYQHCIVGGGDSAFYWGAALGPHGPSLRQAAMRRLPMSAGSELFRQHYANWAQHLGKRVQGRVGYVDQHLVALSHGSLATRDYAGRHKVLSLFDPYTDVVIDDSGAWRWASSKPELHTVVRAYFVNRNEDA
jgi:hypothetical protein